MNWLKRKLHRCKPPSNVFAEELGLEIVCLVCGTVWIYECRFIDVEVSPAVWDRWADIQKEPHTGWYKKESDGEKGKASGDAVPKLRQDG